MELLADWFAAATSYSGKWPSDGDWPWLTRRYKHVTESMHCANETLLSALLVLLGFEKCLMTALHGEAHDQQVYDWHCAREQLTAYPEQQRKFDAVHALYNARRSE